MEIARIGLGSSEKIPTPFLCLFSPSSLPPSLSSTLFLPLLPPLLIIDLNLTHLSDNAYHKVETLTSAIFKDFSLKYSHKIKKKKRFFLKNDLSLDCFLPSRLSKSNHLPSANTHGDLPNKYRLPWKPNQRRIER